MMIIISTTNGYNHRRYTRPWCARVSTWTNKQPILAWGDYLGDSEHGGRCQVEAAPGDVVRWGQKDLRRGDKSESHWGIITTSGMVIGCTAAEAYDAYHQRSET